MKRNFVYVFAIFILIIISGKFLFAKEVEINSGYLQYDDAEQYLVAKGTVTLGWENKLIKADTVHFWIDRDYVEAFGNIHLEDSGNAIFGDSLSYDLKKETGTLDKTSGVFSPWIFHSAKTSKINDKTYLLKTTKFTTCDYLKPHYYISASRARVVTGKRIYIYNPVFFVNDLPVLYLPLFTQGLGKRKHSLEIYPGYNNIDGIVMRVIYGYPLTENTYGKIYLDSFSKRGLGTGLEYNYNIPDRMRGTLYGYHIKERNTDALNNVYDSERWNIRAEHWGKINSYWTSQAKLDFLSDASFNNLYFQENWLRIARELNSSVSFTRQTSKSSLRISADRKDTYSLAANDFKPQYINFPLIEYSRFPKQTFLGFYVAYNASLLNQYTLANDYYGWSCVADVNIYKNFNLTRKLTVTPGFGVNEAWQDRTVKLNALGIFVPGSYDLSNLFVTRFYTSLNLRYRAARWMDWNFLHDYRVRTKINMMDIDTNAVDYGEETNQLVLRNSMYVSRRVIVRNSTTYDLKRLRTLNIDDWRLRFSPLVNEITWQPSFLYTVYTREASTIYPHKLSSVQTLFIYGRKEDKYLNFGVFYAGERPTQADFNVGFGLNPTQKWRIEYNVYTSALRDLREYKTNDQELTVNRDLHCWLLKVRFRKRLDYEEVYLSIDLKTSDVERKKLFNRPHEKEFYPWR